MKNSNTALSSSIIVMGSKLRLMERTISSLEEVNEKNYEILNSSMSGICGIDNIPSLEDFVSPLTSKASYSRLSHLTVLQVKDDLEHLLSLAINNIKSQNKNNTIKVEYLEEDRKNLVVLADKIPSKIELGTSKLSLNYNLSKAVNQREIYSGTDFTSPSYLRYLSASAVSNMVKINELFIFLNVAVNKYCSRVKIMKKYIEDNVYENTSVDGVFTKLKDIVNEDISVLNLVIASQADGLINDGKITQKLKPILNDCRNEISISVQGIPAVITSCDYTSGIDKTMFGDRIEDIDSLSKLIKDITTITIPTLTDFDSSEIFDKIKEANESVIECGLKIIEKTNNEEATQLKILSLLITPLQTLSAFTDLSKWLIDNSHSNRSCLKRVTKCLKVYCDSTLEE